MRMDSDSPLAGGPHPGSYYSPTLPQKRLGEGWTRRLGSVRCAGRGVQRTVAAGLSSRGTV
jgi:hypothetical protein